MENDAANCGACGLNCPVGAQCDVETCTWPDAGYASCTEGTCAPGFSCGPQINACSPSSCAGQADGTRCQTPTYLGLCCEGGCSDPTLDRANCGTCGTSCPAGEFCDFGSCQKDVICQQSTHDEGCDLADAGTGRCCETSCTDLPRDPQNCGACGQVCMAGTTCIRGSCEYPDAGAPSSCGVGQCPRGTSCAASYLTYCVATACATGSDQMPCILGSSVGTCCSQSCTDIDLDDQNCLSCGAACSATEFCYYGCTQNPSCSTDAQLGDTCAVDGGIGRCCPGACADTRSDALNCGGCGFVCAPGTGCIASSCLFPDAGAAGCGPSGSAPCPGGSSCLPRYGAACGTTDCSSALDGEGCYAADGVSGQCCNGACYDVSTSTSNCGRCGTVCTASDFCSNGSCEAVPTCGASNLGATCPYDGGLGSCCYDGCADLTSFPTDCGACGLTCMSGTECISGSCLLADAGYIACVPQQCPRGTDCYVTSEAYCAPSSCSTTDGAPCSLQPGEGACCSGACVNTQTDDAHCGSCGTACGATQFCYDSCRPTPSCSAQNEGSLCPVDGGLGDCCPSGCAALSSDPMNCDGCGFTCMQGTICLGGSCLFVDAGYPDCSLGGCPNGFGCYSGGDCLSTDCSQTPDGNACLLPNDVRGLCCAGTCTDPSTDSNNCQSCGTVCSPGSYCYYGCQTQPACGISNENDQCGFDATELGTCCPGGCTETSSDPQNCFRCGLECAPGLVCMNERCTYPDAGYASDICASVTCPRGTSCTQVNSGTVCALSSCADPSLDGEACVLASGSLGECCSGSCSDPQQDSSDCGHCGNACPGNEFCQSGSCQLTPTCSPSTVGRPCPFTSSEEGSCCESACVELSTDPQHCGTCETQCPPGLQCTGGSCRFPDAGYFSCPSPVACPSGTVCVPSATTCYPTSCGQDQTDYEPCAGPDAGSWYCCTATCSSLEDDSNCGACGRACTSGTHCRSGACQ